MAVMKLPEEIEIDILSRLPVESLVRFRCVSKRYRSLISNPYFVKFHLNRSILSKNYQKVFCPSFPPQSIDYESLLDNNKNDFNVDNNALVELDCPLWGQDSQVSVIGSCNGLICYIVDQINVILYNPSTRVYKQLPKPPGTALLFGRTGKIGFYYGFAFESSEDDYKVVLGADNCDAAFKTIKFYMYSLRHNSWRRIQDLGCSYLRVCSNGIFLNGALHWLVMPIGIGFDQLQVLIVCLELSKGVFSRMTVDIQGEKKLLFYTLGVFEECLYALCFRRMSVEVWLMKEYGVNASWTKFITIPCDVDICLSPLCFLRNGELLLNNILSGSRLHSDQTELGSYNTKKESFTRICNCPCSSRAVLYVESLVSPNSFDGNDK